MATDLPAPGSPPTSLLRSARVTSTRLPSSSVPRWTGFHIDSGSTGTVAVSAGVTSVVTGCAPSRVRDGQAPEGSRALPARRWWLGGGPAGPGLGVDRQR